MHIKKKAILLFLVITIVSALCGCSISSPSKESSVTSESQATTAAVEAPPDEISDFAHSYNSLSSTCARQLYMKIDEKSKLLTSEAIEINSELTEMQISEALEAYINDHPEDFWLTSVYNYYTEDGITNIKLNFRMEGSELLSARKNFEAEVNKIINGGKALSSQYEKELYINDYIADICTYDKAATDTKNETRYENSAYGALVDKLAVCEGYARAFQLLCNKLSVDCVTVSGVADGVNHAWNCAMIDGEWYQVDVTWNDPDGDRLLYKNNYFNLTDEQMYEDHTPSKTFDKCSEAEYKNMDVWFNNFLPKCTSTKYNYYCQSCVTISNVEDCSELSEAIAEAAKNGDGYISFVVDDSLDFESTYSSALYDGYIADWIDKANLKNLYSPELNNECCVYKIENQRVITLELKYI